MRSADVFRAVDWVLAGAAFLLVCVGLAMLFSASYLQEGLFASRFLRQGAAFAIALLLAFFVVRLHYNVVQRLSLVIYGLGVVGLVVVALSAQVIRGSASRLSVAGVQIQPSEFMKIAIVIAFAWLFARSRHLTWKTFLQSVVLLAIPAALIMFEPDLGVAMLFVALWGILLIFLGLPLSAIAGLGLVSLAAAYGAWQWLFADYQKARVLVFLDPTRDPLGAGYNIVQSIVALGSGRFFGRGLGHGPQSQLKFLPEQHTDFIFSSIGEELGVVGVVVVIILYGVLLWRILLIARSTQDSFGQLVAVGTFLVLLVSFVVSAGMNMGLLPVTGIPLPLVSYGGSNLVSTFVLLALVESVRVYSKWVQAPPREFSQFT